MSAQEEGRPPYLARGVPFVKSELHLRAIPCNSDVCIALSEVAETQDFLSCFFYPPKDDIHILLCLELDFIQLRCVANSIS